MFDLNSLIKRKSFEKIVFMLRRHPITFLSDIALIIVLAAVPVGLYLGIQRVAPLLLADRFMRPALIIVCSGYCLVIWTFFMTRFVDYYLDFWIVTNDKILNVEQNGLFSRTVSELELARVQDVTSEIKGIIPTIFNFGNVYIQTAGEVEHFIFEQVPHPDEIRKQIIDLAEVERKRLGEVSVAAVTGEST